MKITREDFKELIALCKEINSYSSECSNYLSDKAVEKLGYSALDWIVKKLDIDDWFYDFCFDDDGHIIVDYDYIDENGFYVHPVYSSDLDEIYDLLNNENEELFE